MTTDEEAEAFLEQDLSDLDFSQFKPVKFEFIAKDERINMRLPGPLLKAVKAKAKTAKMPYQRYIRAVLEEAVQAKRPPLLDAPTQEKSRGKSKFRALSP